MTDGRRIPARKRMTGRQMVEAFNAVCAVGDAVTRTDDHGVKHATRTRSEAYLLSGHTPVVMVEGVTGCYLLSRVTVVR